MSVYEFQAKWKQYMNYKYLERKGIQGKQLVNEPIPPEEIATEAAKIMQQWNMLTYERKKKVDSSDEETTSSSEKERDIALKKKIKTIHKGKKLIIESSVSGSDEDSMGYQLDNISNWKVAKYVNNENKQFDNKVWLRCKWNTEKKESWDVFEAVQQDEPEMVAKYVNKNIDLYKMIKKYETISLELQEKITIPEADLLDENNETVLVAMDAQDETCNRDHTSLYNFTDYSDPKYFAERMSLHKAICNVCHESMNQQKMNVNAPAKVCSSHGSLGCNICVCYSCSINIMLNMDTRKRKR
jgi:hypothetical protein